jgi:hypothetical protein
LSNTTSRTGRAGTVDGTGGTAVAFVGTVANLLILEPSDEFDGLVVGSASDDNALELASGSTTVTLAGLGSGNRLAGAVGDAPASEKALRAALDLYRSIGAIGHAERLARAFRWQVAGWMRYPYNP